jgi:hypothetical protein
MRSFPPSTKHLVPMLATSFPPFARPSEAATFSCLALLDLCSVTIVHRFTSPEWMQSLKAHLAAVASDMVDQVPDSSGRQHSTERISGAKSNTASLIFREIVGLRVGEALLFSPSAMVDADMASSDASRYARLGTGFLKVRVRTRLTTDGGKSVLAA